MTVKKPFLHGPTIPNGSQVVKLGSATLGVPTSAIVRVAATGRMATLVLGDRVHVLVLHRTGRIREVRIDPKTATKLRKLILIDAAGYVPMKT